MPPSVVEQAESHMFLQKHSLLDTHPSLAARMRNLGTVSAKEWVVDKPATRLFKDWDNLEREITKEMVEWGREAFAEHLHRLDFELRRGPARAATSYQVSDGD